MSIFVTWMGVIVLVVAVLFILSIAPLNIVLSLSYQSGHQVTNVEIRYLYIIRFKKSIMEKREQAVVATSSQSQNSSFTAHPASAIESFFHRINEYMDEIERLRTPLHRFINVFSVRNVTWTTNIGVEDAAMTAWLCGVFWMIQSMITGILTRFVRVVEIPELMVTPQFSQQTFTTHLSCIVTGPVGKTIVASLKLFLRYKKGGAYARTSNSVANANSHGKPEGNG